MRISCTETIHKAAGFGCVGLLLKWAQEEEASLTQEESSPQMGVCLSREKVPGADV